MTEFSEKVKRTIRQCWGLKPDDTSRDKDLERVSSMRAFEYMCQWNFGDAIWAFDFWGWLDGCGFDVKEK